MYTYVCIFDDIKSEPDVNTETVSGINTAQLEGKDDWA